MKGKGSKLASRFRSTLDAQQLEETEARRSKEERLLSASLARKELFDELSSMGEVIGGLSVTREVNTMTLRRGDFELQFIGAENKPTVKVVVANWSGIEDLHLRQEPDLRESWALCFIRRGQEERILLFDDGLEELFVRGLGLPRPEDEEADDVAPAMSARLAEAMLRPESVNPSESVANPSDDGEKPPPPKKRL